MNTSRARILRDLDGAGPLRHSELVMRAESRHLRGLLYGRADAPTRGTEALVRDREAFAGNVLALLDTHRRAADFDLLAVFATPEMLIILDRGMGPALRRRLAAAQTADLVGAPPEHLARIARDALAAS